MKSGGSIQFANCKRLPGRVFLLSQYQSTTSRPANPANLSPARAKMHSHQWASPKRSRRFCSMALAAHLASFQCTNIEFPVLKINMSSWNFRGFTPVALWFSDVINACSLVLNIILVGYVMDTHMSTCIFKTNKQFFHVETQVQTPKFPDSLW